MTITIKNFAIVIIVIALLGTGGYFYSTNESFITATNDFVMKNIIGKETPPPALKPAYQTWIYFFGDGTGNCTVKYAIPKVDTIHLGEAADHIHINGGGRLWLSYFDSDSKNNKVIYAYIPERIVKQPKPQIVNGETSFESYDKLKLWEQSTSYFLADSLERENEYKKLKYTFLKDVEILLSKKVYVKGLKENLNSDIVGGLNSAFNTISINTDTIPAYKYVVAFSDLEHAAPNLNPKPILGNIPDGVKVIVVNPALGSTKKCIDEVLELESTDRVLETIFNHQ